MLPVATFTTQVLLLSTGGGLLTNGLRALLGNEEALCPLDGDLSDSMSFRFAHMADPLVDDDPTLDDEPTDQAAQPTLGSLAQLQVWWEMNATLRERFGLQHAAMMEEQALFAPSSLPLGALAAAGLVFAARRWVRHAKRFRLAVDGARCELIDSRRYTVEPGLAFEPVWLLLAWPSRSSAISRAEKQLETALLQSECGTAYLIVNA